MTPQEKLVMARECAAAICDEDKCSPLVVAGFADSQFDDHPAVRCALLAIDRMQERVRAEGLIAALSKAAERFREYEYSHAAKGSIDGDAKARRNCEMAEMCEIALTAYRSDKTH